MTDTKKVPSPEKVVPQTVTVAQTVLEKFFIELAKTDGFADIGPKMRKVVVEDGVFAESAIRAALFPETP